MSTGRIYSLNGNPATASNIKTFGQTISDRQSDPNVSQITYIQPTVDGSTTSLQKYSYLISTSLKSPNAGTTPAAATGSNTLVANPDLKLVTNKYYQFSANLTLILRPTNSSSYITGTWTISGAARNSTLIGTQQYQLTTVSVDSGMSTYVPNSAIVLRITSNKFKIVITPIANISYSADLLADSTITASSYSNTA